MLINERGVREHIAAATAALNQPGGGKGAVMAEQADYGNQPVLASPLVGRVECGLARRQHHDHLAAFEARFLLDLGDLRGIDLDPV